MTNDIVADLTRQWPKARRIESSWRLRTLLRTRRFFSHRELLLHFKSHVLSYLEYRTPAIFHATSTVLSPLDRILHNLLHELDIPLDTALFEFNLSPLETRRDIAMLGVIHRAVLRSGPSQLFQFFRRSFLRTSSRRHSRQLLDVRSGRRLCMLDRSVLGMIWVYNLLPEEVVAANTVRKFQSHLQSIVRFFCSSAHPHWSFCLSNRLSTVGHPLSLLSVHWSPCR